MTTLTVEAGQPLAHDNEFLAWLRHHGIEPFDTFKVEIGNDELVAHQFVRDGKGLIRHNDGDPEVKTQTVVIESPPPVGEGQ